jgi:hypothetical protein
MATLKKGKLREGGRYIWGCGRSPHPHIYLPLSFDGVFSVDSIIFHTLICTEVSEYLENLRISARGGY